MTATKKQAPKVVPMLVADDNGYADHKLAWLDSDGNIQTGKVPSVIQAGGQGISDTLGQRKGLYVADGVEYTCSNVVNDPMSLRNADYPVSVANRVLLTHALARFGLLDKPLKVALTLPFRDFYHADGSINVSLKDKCAQNFMVRNVEVMDSEAQPVIESVGVYAEALSAWFDWAFTDHGDLSDGYQEMCDLQGEVLVVDIGGSTTDLASLQMTNDTYEGELAINHGKSGTERVGVLDARTKLDELVRKVMASEGVEGLDGHGSSLPSHWLDRVLSKGKASYAGRTWDFEAERDTACRGVAERICNFIKSKAGNPSSYFTILVVGGGAIVFKPWISKVLPNASFKDEFANAKGLLKFMRSQHQE